MKREILLHHEAVAVAAKNGCAGLYELVQHEHEWIALQKGPEQVQLPSVEFAFFFNPAAGEGGIIQATCGASHEEDGLEGCRYTFSSERAHEARQALLAELAQLIEEQPGLKLVAA